MGSLSTAAEGATARERTPSSAHRGDSPRRGRRLPQLQHDDVAVDGPERPTSPCGASRRRSTPRQRGDASPTRTTSSSPADYTILFHPQTGFGGFYNNAFKRDFGVPIGKPQ